MPIIEPVPFIVHPEGVLGNLFGTRLARHSAKPLLEEIDEIRRATPESLESLLQQNQLKPDSPERFIDFDFESVEAGSKYNPKSGYVVRFSYGGKNYEIDITRSMSGKLNFDLIGVAHYFKSASSVKEAVNNALLWHAALKFAEGNIDKVAQMTFDVLGQEPVIKILGGSVQNNKTKVGVWDDWDCGRSDLDYVAPHLLVSSTGRMKSGAEATIKDKVGIYWISGDRFEVFADGYIPVAVFDKDGTLIQQNDGYKPPNQEISFAFNGSPLKAETFYNRVGTLRTVKRMAIDAWTSEDDGTTIRSFGRMTYKIKYSPDSKTYELARYGDKTSLDKITRDLEHIDSMFTRLK